MSKIIQHFALLRWLVEIVEYLRHGMVMFHVEEHKSAVDADIAFQQSLMAAKKVNIATVNTIRTNKQFIKEVLSGHGE